MDFPCTGCEHLESEHYHIAGAPNWCEKCFYKSTIWQHMFKADNLKYLEQLSETL
jgi:hypothetical protein